MRNAMVTALLFGAAATLFQSGCWRATESSPADDHLEHHVPEHRPRSFSQGVTQIERRLALITAGPADSNDDFEQQATELREILEWIPDLAGDSDMKKAEWDQVNAAARELLHEYNRALPQWRTGSPSAGSALTAPLARLRALAQAASAAAPNAEQAPPLPVSGALGESSL